MNWMQVKTSVDWGDCIIDAFTKVGIKVEILGNKCAIVQSNSYIFIQNCIYSKNSGSFDLSFKSKNDRTFNDDSNSNSPHFKRKLSGGKEE